MSQINWAKLTSRLCKIACRFFRIFESHQLLTKSTIQKFTDTHIVLPILEVMSSVMSLLAERALVLLTQLKFIIRFNQNRDQNPGEILEVSSYLISAVLRHD